ncbi:hypothetical protein ACKKBG_A19595 [Auxenochlorella protothecoides x Auxenochlorella symbiontica]|uniref:Uncharacterized protein n=1 Tax=Auxenochlorella protothecoides TaxID=3075 RepID=A0A1D2ADD4_AUXPR
MGIKSWFHKRKSDGNDAAVDKEAAVHDGGPPPPPRVPVPLRKNPLSYLLFSWFTPLLLLGWRRPLQFEDLFVIPEELTTAAVFPPYTAGWNRLVREARDGGPKGQRRLEDSRLGRSTAFMLTNFIRLHWVRVSVALSIQLLYSATTFAGPLLLNKIVRFLQTPEALQDAEGLKQAYLYAMGMFLAPVVGTLINGMANRVSIGTQVIIRAELNAAIYAKALRLSNRARQQSDTGRIVNLMSADVNQLQMFFYPYVQQLVTGPATIIAALVLLWFQISWTTFIGLAILLVSTPLTGIFVAKLSAYRREMLKYTDKRVKLMNQLLVGIRVLKMYAWEAAQEAAIMEVRKDELWQLRKAIPYRAAMQCLLFSAPALAMVACFSAYGATSPDGFTPAAIFTSIALFGLMRFPLIFLPFALVQLANAFVSIRRLTVFFMSEDRIEHVEELDRPGIEVEDASFFWAEPPPRVEIEQGKKKKKGRKDKNGKGNAPVKGANGLAKESAQSADGGLGASSESSAPDSGAATPVVTKGQPLPATDLVVDGILVPAKPAEGEEAANRGQKDALFWLRNISLQIKPGELVCCVGRVGMGKSSLVQAILGEMDKETGHVRVGGSMAYVAQQAWIINASVKENVSFGKEWDEAKWNATVEACCLSQDLETLPGGADTEIGEKGINLSGGQKQRVSLARAMYQDADVYIMDDPLSAVDVHVGRHIFENLITGALKGKTRLLVTNQLQYCHHADQIIVVDEGQVVVQGTYETCMAHPTFAGLVREHAAEAGADEEAPEPAPFAKKGSGELVMRAVSRSEVALQEVLEEVEGTPEDAIDGPPHGQATKPAVTGSMLVRPSKGSSSSATKKHDVKAPMPGALMVVEDKEEGQVAWSVYWRYITCYGRWAALALLVFWSGEETTSVLTNWWLSKWSTAETLNAVQVQAGIPSDFSRISYIGGYLGFAFAYVILVTLRTIANLASSLTASRLIHERSLLSLDRSPVTFFDTTPIGRILNRFSKDTGDMDFMLSMSLSQLGTCVMNLLGTIIFIAVIQPWILVGIAPLTIVYYFIQKFYRRSYIEFQRQDATSRSPIYAHFSETLSGVDTIRAYRLSDAFAADSQGRVDANHRAYWCLSMANEWLSLRLDFMGAIIVFLVAILSIVNRNSINVALMALTLSQALSVTQFLKVVVTTAAQFESRFNSVERLFAYWDLPQEAPAYLPGKEAPDAWPDKGALQYTDVWMRYRAELGPVLKGVTFFVAPGEKVGIVGRTGSGKSSLIVSLFRLVEPYQGSIALDGIDLLSLGLNDVRSRIAVIPQDPVLFSGSVRANLDPYDRYTDAEVWEALTHVAMRGPVAALPEGLSARVAEGGDNFSVGQRQLFCVARALLREPQVLVADEATASVDSETDTLIQQTIRREFRHCTVLTIAHRINTILDATKVLVMEDGKVAEYDTVAHLMSRGTSSFRAMAQEAGVGSKYRLDPGPE